MLLVAKLEGDCDDTRKERNRKRGEERGIMKFARFNCFFF